MVQWTGNRVALVCRDIVFSGQRKRCGTMPEQQNQQTPASLDSFKPDSFKPDPFKPDSPIPAPGMKPQWIPTENEKQNLRWVIEQELRKELGVPPKSDPPRFKIEFHRRQLALLLDKANEAPRCAHVFADGRCCQAPRVKKGKLCYAHAQMETRKPQRMNLPPLEDANAVMIWLMEVSRGLLDGQISERTAGLMFYGLQLAMVNARHITFKETDPMEMVRTAPKNRRDRTSSPKAELQGGEGSAQEARNSGRNEAELEGNPGVESSKSIFFGVDAVEGVTDDCPDAPRSQPVRKSSQSEGFMDLRECAEG